METLTKISDSSLKFKEALEGMWGFYKNISVLSVCYSRAKFYHYAYPVELVNKNLTEAQPGFG